MIRQDLFYKLLALVIATFLWAYVNAERNPRARKVVTAPLEVRNLAKGYVAELSAAKVSVTIEGPKSGVDAVRSEDVSAWIDLKGLKVGPALIKSKANVAARVAGASEDQLAVSVSPSPVQVRAEAIRSKRLPVDVKLLTAPPLGYSYADPVVEPGSVGVKGKASDVARVKRVLLFLADRSMGKAIDGYFEVTPTDSAGNRVGSVTVDTEKVHLKLGIVEVPATKAVVVSESIVGRPAFPATVISVSVTPPSVTLEGKPKILMGLSTIETEDVSVEGETANITRQVGLRVPPGVKVVGSQRVRVTVVIRAKE